MFQEESDANKKAIMEHIRREERDSIEKKLAFQHKAFRGKTGDVVDALKGNHLPIKCTMYEYYATRSRHLIVEHMAMKKSH